MIPTLGAVICIVTLTVIVLIYRNSVLVVEDENNKRIADTSKNTPDLSLAKNAKPLPVTTINDFPTKVNTDNYMQGKNHEIKDFLASKPKEKKLASLRSIWKPQVNRNTSPDMAQKIDNIIQAAITNLGYDKIETLKLTRIQTIKMGDNLSSESQSKTLTAYESYINPDWMRREIYSGTPESEGEPSLVEVVSGKLVLQAEPDSDPVDDVNLYDDTRWYNLSNHPLMLHHELNPLIYESLTVRELSDNEATEIGASSSVGHQIAILKTPGATIKKGHDLSFETWLDIENGHILYYAMYHNNESVKQSKNYIYEEISDGIFIPISHVTIIGGGAGKIYENIVDIKIDEAVDQEQALSFRNK